MQHEELVPHAGDTGRATEASDMEARAKAIRAKHAKENA